MNARRCALALAIGATATALCLSILAGWQRGGSLAERAVWVAIGMVLVVSAHLLPALLRDASIVIRGVGSALWIACLATSCYGHAVFFAFAQQHAGELRASAVPTAAFAPFGRSLTAVMTDRANVTRQLAFAQAQHCPRDCSGLDARRTALAAKLDALNAEVDDVRRRQVADDRVMERYDAVRSDPVTSRLAPLLSTTVARVDLLSGLMFAAVLEGVACLLWTVALRPSSLPAAAAAVTGTTSTAVTPLQQHSEDAGDVTLPEVTPVASVSTVTRLTVKAVAASHADRTVGSEAQSESRTVMENSLAPRDDPITPLPDGAPPGGEVTQLAQAIAAGLLRPTVAEIRRHVGCSQARAAALRRQLTERNTTA